MVFLNCQLHWSVNLVVISVFPLSIATVDYEKAFDSVQIQAVLTSFQEQGKEDVYIELLKEIYTNSSMTVHLHKERRYPIAQAVYGSTRKHIPTIDLGKQNLEDRRRIS